MTAHTSAHGRLIADPTHKITDSGTALAMGRLVVSLPCHTAEDGAAPLWLGVVCFGKVADTLKRCRKGDVISISGAMQISQWRGQDGHPTERRECGRGHCGACQS